MDRNIVEYIKGHVKEYLPPEYREAYVDVREVLKSNDQVMTGMTILKDGDNITPMIYLDPYGEDIEAGRPMASVLEDIAWIQQKAVGRTQLVPSVLEDYEKVRPMLSVKLCDPERNQEYLKDKPYTACGELAAVYRIQVMADEDGGGTGTIAVTYDMLRLWKVTTKRLHQDAVGAESVRNPPRLYRVDDILSLPEWDDMLGAGGSQQADPIPMYVLTNRNRMDGAAVIAFDGVLDGVGELLGKNFYLLPSSVHEMVILPDDGVVRTEDFEKLVRDINAEMLSPYERLSEKVQYYDRETKTLGRKKEKGLLEQLAECKIQAREKDAGAVREKGKQADKGGPCL